MTPSRLIALLVAWIALTSACSDDDASSRPPASTLEVCVTTRGCAGIIRPDDAVILFRENGTELASYATAASKDGRATEVGYEFEIWSTESQEIALAADGEASCQERTLEYRGMVAAKGALAQSPQAWLSAQAAGQAGRLRIG